MLYLNSWIWKRNRVALLPTRTAHKQVKMKPFNWRFAILLGISGVLANTFWVPFNAYIPLFLQAGHPLAPSDAIAGFALSPLATNFIMTWDNIFHMILSPWVGARSDRTWNRFGRRKPWLLVGFPIAAVAFWFLPLATSLVALMLLILVVNLGTGLFRAPIRAWVGDFYAPADRMKGESAFHLVGGVAAVLVAFVGGLLFDARGRAAPFVLTVGFMTVVALFIVLWVREDEHALADAGVEDSVALGAFVRGIFRPKNRPLLLALISITLANAAQAALQANFAAFSIFEVGTTAGRASQLLGLSILIYAIAVLPCNLLSTRYGMRQVMLMAMGIYTASTIVILLAVSDERTFLIALLPTSIAWAAVFANCLPLLLSFNRSAQPGLFTGLFFFTFQLASIVGPLLAGIAITLFDSQRVMWGVSALLMLFAFGALLQVRKG